MGGKISSKLSSGPAKTLQMVFAMEGNEKVKKTQVSRAMVVVDPDLQIPEPHEETHVGRDARQLSSTVLGVVAGSRNRRLKIICNLKIKF